MMSPSRPYISAGLVVLRRASSKQLRGPCACVAAQVRNKKARRRCAVRCLPLGCRGCASRVRRTRPGSKPSGTADERSCATVRGAQPPRWLATPPSRMPPLIRARPSPYREL
ncbi:unnamed protein product [Amoebophrya sp. A120]|nr:unnamed protein product [Amoebophrya sp. A120]|eukprot:GSA120T00014087001.1